jgi:hypothetical protein
MDSIFYWADDISNSLLKKMNEVETDEDKKVLKLYSRFFLNQAKTYKYFRGYTGDVKVEGVTALYFEKYRDSIMADNVMWFIREFYPDKKIIISATSFHNGRFAHEISNMDESYIGTGTTTMGEYLYNNFKDSFFSIACIGIHDLKSEPAVNKYIEYYYKTPESLEFQLKSEGHKRAFIDLSQDNVDEVFTIYPTYNRPYTTKWSHHFDGLIFLERIKSNFTCFYMLQRSNRNFKYFWPDFWFK